MDHEEEPLLLGFLLVPAVFSYSDVLLCPAFVLHFQFFFFAGLTRSTAESEKGILRPIILSLYIVPGIICL